MSTPHDPVRTDGALDELPGTRVRARLPVNAS